jgi:hypothetical protein
MQHQPTGAMLGTINQGHGGLNMDDPLLTNYEGGRSFSITKHGTLGNFTVRNATGEPSSKLYAKIILPEEAAKEIKRKMKYRYQKPGAHDEASLNIHHYLQPSSRYAYQPRIPTRKNLDIKRWK